MEIDAKRKKRNIGILKVNEKVTVKDSVVASDTIQNLNISANYNTILENFPNVVKKMVCSHSEILRRILDMSASSTKVLDVFKAESDKNRAFRIQQKTKELHQALIVPNRACAYQERGMSCHMGLILSKRYFCKRIDIGKARIMKINRRSVWIVHDDLGKLKMDVVLHKQHDYAYPALWTEIGQKIHLRHMITHDNAIFSKFNLSTKRKINLHRWRKPNISVAACLFQTDIKKFDMVDSVLKNKNLSKCVLDYVGNPAYFSSER